MRFLLFPFLLFVFCLNAQAQKYELSLKQHKLEKPVRNINIDQIIDLRYDQTSIGWVNEGMINFKTIADFDDNFTTTLEDFIKANSSVSGQSIPVIMKVNKFLISERTEPTREYATADISLEFLAKKDSGFIKITEATSIIQTTSRIDITGNHPENIVKALEECFAKLAAVNIAEHLKTGEVLSPDYLRVNSYYQLTKFDLPILKTRNPKAGVYNSFAEFLNNEPGSLGGHKLTVEEAMDQLRQRKKLDNFWGFSDGKTAHVFFLDSYFPLARRDDYFYFTGFLPIDNSNAIIAGSMMGGIAGGLIAHAITAAHEEVEFAVNMVTGKINYLHTYNPRADLAKTAKVILYRKSKKESRNKLPVFINDSLYASLLPNTLAELNFNFPAPGLKICLQKPDQSGLLIVPAVGETVYVECSFPEKNGSAPNMKVVSEKEAAYYLKIINHTMEKGKK